ncbi:uncharacterized protein LOC106162966 isoform X2 [Lingula anatina]|uniref:lactoylglutathione lyase n=1 Tax=Lingula anatina TaxID=7574 RepID=A0A1S3ICB6_LINAN|nr:uncharacterized protein LOC106162966 isoform X1 [Lingula anatina]XP_013395890.1 uncharacterized protein LOC106162966 isoform X2 [Lingula anatina]|eukprot:XP_013395882.1 uncharacterized protein LOC106162966 isoform X1 [Lingula anatina]
MDAKPIPFEEVERCVKPPPPETKTYSFHHTCYRIKDPRVTVDFYSRVLGMKLIATLPLENLKTTMYFMGYTEEGEKVPSDFKERMEFLLHRKKHTPVIEFLHNWGTENMPDLKLHDGNKAPKGYSHICVAVQDADAEIKRVANLGVRVIKESGGQGYAFIEDPDGYWVEFLDGDRLGSPGDPNIDITEMKAAIGF